MKTSKIFMDNCAELALWTRVADGYIIETKDYSIESNFEAISRVLGHPPVFIEACEIESILKSAGFEYIGEL